MKLIRNYPYPSVFLRSGSPHRPPEPVSTRQRLLSFLFS